MIRSFSSKLLVQTTIVIVPFRMSMDFPSPVALTQRTSWPSKILAVHSGCNRCNLYGSEGPTSRRSWPTPRSENQVYSTSLLDQLKGGGISDIRCIIYNRNA